MHLTRGCRALIKFTHRYEGTDDLFCSGGGYSQFSSCPEAKEYFIVAGGETDQEIDKYSHFALLFCVVAQLLCN